MFLNQALAKAIDVELMRAPGFSLDQLMELAGLSVSCLLVSVDVDRKGTRSNSLGFTQTGRLRSCTSVSGRGIEDSDHRGSREQRG